MKSSEYYGIQFAQSRYLLMWEAAQHGEMVEKAFSRRPDIRVSYEGFLPPAGDRPAVEAFFTEMARLVRENGGIVRNDLPNSQYISVASDGQSAVGRWLTMSALIDGPAFGHTDKPYPYRYYIGAYRNGFVREDGEWRLHSVDWKPLMDIGDWTMDPARGGGLYYKQPEKWPRPFTRARPVQDNASAATEENIALRTVAFAFAHDYTARGPAAITGELFSDAAAAGAREMLPASPGALLLTSPIAALDDTLRHAELFLNTMRILPGGDARREMVMSKGRICARMSKRAGDWRFDSFAWYPYATLEPWRLNAAYPYELL